MFSFFATGSGLCVDVRDCVARLCVFDGERSVYLADDAYSAALYDELLDYVEAAGGAVNISGLYFIPLAALGEFPHIAAAAEILLAALEAGE